MKSNILALVCLFSMSYAEYSDKIFAPYCGPKTSDVRYCNYDQDCKYSDEYCAAERVCTVNKPLYDKDPCKCWTDNGSGDVCSAMICPTDTTCKDGVCI